MTGITRPLLKKKEVAELLGVSYRTLSRWIADGRVPTLRLPNGFTRFRPEDIERLIGADK